MTQNSKLETRKSLDGRFRFRPTIFAL